MAGPPSGVTEFRSRLYRNLWQAVILGGLVALAVQVLPAQVERRPKADQGPRAVGLLEMAPNGKAHLIPVVIMYDGEFYDASVYKASPVPMALDPGTVYEAERTGASLGLFTITGDLQSHNNTWMAEGTFEPAGAKPKSRGHIAKSVPRGMEADDSGPPRLLRRQPSEKPAPTPSPSASAPAPAPASPAPSSTASSSAPAKSGTPSGSTASTPSAPAAAASSSPAEQSANAKAAPTAAPPAQQEDVYRPVLRRGKSEWTSPQKPAASLEVPAAASKTAIIAKSSTGIQVIPAVSDAGGPEPHPYTYSMKPAEEQQIHKKMLAMAAQDVLARVQQLTSEEVTAPTSKRTSRHVRTTKAPQPVFSDVQLHVLDLSLSNEPVAILTATAHMPPATNSADLQYYVALVAHEDIYGDLHKAFSQVTDNRHLDVRKRYEFIDAVDADGDGRGELLFRTISDAGKAYTVFRLIGDQVWPLFEGTPGP